MKKTVPLLIDPNDFFKRAKIMREFQLRGYLNVEITDIPKLDKLLVPEFLLEFAASVDCDIADLINIVLRDWCMKLKEGESKYRKGIIHRIANAPADVIPEEIKNNLLLHIHSEIPELTIKRKLKPNKIRR